MARRDVHVDPSVKLHAALALITSAGAKHGACSSAAVYLRKNGTIQIGIQEHNLDAATIWDAAVDLMSGLLPYAAKSMDMPIREFINPWLANIAIQEAMLDVIVEEPEIDSVKPEEDTV